jgi:hypothetical protein
VDRTVAPCSVHDPAEVRNRRAVHMTNGGTGPLEQPAEGQTLRKPGTSDVPWGRMSGRDAPYWGRMRVKKLATKASIEAKARNCWPS